MPSGSHRRSPGQQISGILGAILTMVLVSACTTPGNTPGDEPRGSASNIGRAPPKDHIQRSNFAVHLTISGELERAKRIADQALSQPGLSATERAGYLYVLGAYHMRKRNFEQGLNYYAQAAKDDTFVAPKALAIRAPYLQKLRRNQEALADVDRCLKLTGKRPIIANSRCYVSQSMALFALKRFAAAERAAQAAINGGLTNRVAPWRMLGMSQLMQEKYSAAEKSFSRGLLVDPSDNVSRAGLRLAIARDSPVLP